MQSDDTAQKAIQTTSDRAGKGMGGQETVMGHVAGAATARVAAESWAFDRKAGAALLTGKSFALGLAAAESVSWLRMLLVVPAIAIVFVYSYICARQAN